MPHRLWFLIGAGGRAHSVGLVLLQLATPSLHTEPAMRVKCRQQLDLKCGRQLYEWRKSAPKVRIPNGAKRSNWGSLG